jgi:RNA polymerase sigma factor (TIGR02999 family)
MRRVLIDHARHQGAAKRFSAKDRITLVTDLALATPQSVDILDLNQALEKFEKISARAAQVVEMRYFSGLTLEEVARVLGISDKTVERDWTAARLWLRRELTE